MQKNSESYHLGCYSNLVSMNIVLLRTLHKMDSLLENEDWTYNSIDSENTRINEISGCKRHLMSRFNQVRLSSSGVVEIKHMDKWGGICKDGFTVKEADVFCKQFGFDLGAAKIGENSEEPYNGHIHVTDLSCQGEESDVRKLI